MKLTIDLTDKQVEFLKEFAANHYPGARDNLATYMPIHVVQSKEYLYIPYCSGSEECFDTSKLRFWREKGGKIYKDEVEFLSDLFNDTEPSMPIEPFGQIRNKGIKVEGETFVVDTYEDYFRAYGVDVPCMGYEMSFYKDVAFFFILKEAKKYIRYQSYNLKEPRTYSFGPGYANKGEYEHFYQLLYDIGKKLNEMEKVTFKDVAFECALKGETCLDKCEEQCPRYYSCDTAASAIDALKRANEDE